MAFVKRKNKVTTKNVEQESTDNKPEILTDNKPIVKSKTQKTEDAFRFKAMEILDILEHRDGVDFYSEDRSGGMYLRGAKQKSRKIPLVNNKQEVDKQKSTFLKNILKK